MSTKEQQNLQGATHISKDIYQPDNDINLLENNMPMVVWIRGDEPYAPEFCIDADEAMNILGIKRSRLTQISGKELRVGRIKVDRYIKPFYRKQDLEEYLKWTRATATHVKSANAINEATQLLSNKAEELCTKLAQTSDDYKNIISDQIKTLNNNISDDYQKTLEQLNTMINTQTTKLQQSLQHHLDIVHKNLDLICNSIKNLHDIVDVIFKNLDTFKSLISDLNSHSLKLESIYNNFVLEIKDNFSRISDMLHQQSTSNRDIGKVLTILMQFLKENLKKQDILISKFESITTHKNSYSKKLHLIKKTNKTHSYLCKKFLQTKKHLKNIT